MKCKWLKPTKTRITYKFLIKNNICIAFITETYTIKSLTPKLYGYLIYYADHHDGTAHKVQS
jgi:uncharacterized protein Usg